MGLLVNGIWQTEEVNTQTPNGHYIRKDSVLRQWVTADGSSDFPAEAGRYHLYVAINCPWAHRAWIFRILKKLEDVISMSIAAPRRTDQGWVFENADPCYQDHVLGRGALHEIYTLA
jgi:putative glutathione S-transferase